MSSVAFDTGWKEFYSASEVQEALEIMAARMADSIKFIRPPNRVVFISILKGGLWTAYHLLDFAMLLDTCADIRIGHLGLSSYGAGRTSGEMKTTYTLDLDVDDVRGSQVWLIDDIWHTGRTIQEATKRVLLFQPHSIRSATLVYRVGGGSTSSPDVYGLQYHGEGFLAGCGMGVGEQDRQHSRIFVEK